jgi:hypothetical protein
VVPEVRPVTVEPTVVFVPLLSVSGEPSTTVNVSKVGVFECMYAIPTVPPPGLMVDVKRTPLLVIAV